MYQDEDIDIQNSWHQNILLHASHYIFTWYMHQKIWVEIYNKIVL